MKRLSFWTLLLVGAMGAGWGFPDQCSAQFIPTGQFNIGRSFNDYLYNRPTVSPYLNLLRTDTGAIFPNYHTLVRPRLEERRALAEQSARIQNMSRRLNQVQREVERGRGPNGELITGHPTRFGNYSHFFPELGIPPNARR